MSREILEMNRNWLFCVNDISETVCLPHTIGLTPAISSGCRNYQGICTYTKEINILSKYKNKKILIEFEGAMGITDIWFNGKHLKTHYCGYIPLIVDISDIVKFDETNTIELKLNNLDNEDVPPGKPQSELDFTYDGGLYRTARIIITDKLYITNPLIENKIAGGGIFVTTNNVLSECADINIKTHVANQTNFKKEFSIIQTLLNDKKEIVTKQCTNVLLNIDCNEHFNSTLKVLNPQLWSPETPYLYQLITTIECDNIICDEIITSVGIRTFEYTFNKGIVFNGVGRKLSGANYHQTYVYIGNAVPDSLLRRDALKLRNMGMKNIRSHYPLSNSFVDACNELGLTLIVSLPGWQFYKDGLFAERALQNMREIIRWQRNNPCIILWESTLNETIVPSWFEQKLHDVVHEEYPYKSCYTASDHGPTDISYRQYDPGMLAPGMENYNVTKRYTGKSDCPVWIREYGDSPDNWTDHNCAWRSPRGWGDYPMVRSVERMIGLDPQCTSNYIDMYNNPNICGYGIWPGIEHNRGYHINPCWGGFMDLYRIPKFSYYFMKSQIDIEEIGIVLFIANWWTELSPNDVTVYSNAQKVRLYHNDVLVDELFPENIDVAHPPFVFKDVRKKFKKRERSILRAEAIVNNRVVETVLQKSPGVPKKLKLEADFMGIPLKADGSDIVMIYCKMLDSDGNIVPMTGDRHPILFSIEGQGSIVGDSSIGANPICTEAGIIAVMVRSTQKSGEIKLRAKMLWKQNNPVTAIQETEIIFNSI